MLIPKNEQGVVMLFGMLAKEHGWGVVSIRAAYPDAVLHDGNGSEWVTEFEFMASNFIDHKHDHRECDLIVCWENDYPKCSLPIIELKSRSFGSIYRSTMAEKTAEYWMLRCFRSERKRKDLIAIVKADMEVRPIGKLSTEERRAELLKLAKDNPHITVVDLSKRLGAVRNTIKSDLDALQSAGLIHRNGVIEVHTNGYHKTEVA